MVAIVLAVLQTSASVTIRWNVAHPQTVKTVPAAKTPPAQSGTLVSVRGDFAEVRLADGSVRRFAATPSEAAALRMLVGHSINFIVK